MTAANEFADDELMVAPKVLLVDDDEVNLLLTAVALRERGFAITEAPSGERAIQLLVDWSPDVIVLDALMPGMDGGELAARVAALRPDTKLLFMSGYPRDAIVHEGVLDPAVDLIAKPFDIAALAARVRRAIDGPAAAAA